MFFALLGGSQHDAQVTRSADFAKNCAVLAFPRPVERLSLEIARKLSMQSVPKHRAHKTNNVSGHRGDNDKRNRREEIERFDHINRLDHVRPENEIDDRLRPAEQH